MLAGWVGRDISVRLEAGEGPLKHVHAPLQCKVLHVLPSGGTPGPSAEGDSLEVDILAPPHPSLRGGRLRLTAHDPASSFEVAGQGREVVVQIELYLPGVGHISDGVGVIEPFT